MVSFSNFVDISSWPELSFGLSLFATVMISVMSTGSMNMLFLLAAVRYLSKVVSDIGTCSLVDLPILTKYLLNASAILDLSVIFSFSMLKD